MDEMVLAQRVHVLMHKDDYWFLVYDSGATQHLTHLGSDFDLTLADKIPVSGSVCGIGQKTLPHRHKGRKLRDQYVIKSFVAASLDAYDLKNTVPAASPCTCSSPEICSSNRPLMDFSIDDVAKWIESDPPSIHLNHVTNDLPAPQCHCYLATPGSLDSVLGNALSLLTMLEYESEPVLSSGGQPEHCAAYISDIWPSLSKADQDFLLHCRLGHYLLMELEK